MRPKSIVLFERLYLGSLVVGILNSAIHWRQLSSVAPVWFVLTVQAATLAILVGLVLLVSRLRSRVAMWIMIVGFLIGIPIALKSLYSGPKLVTVWLGVLETAIQIAAMVLLFSKPAQKWLVRKDEAAT